MIPSPRFVNAIYCDDVRQEVGGKMSIMGIYHGQLNITEPGPIALPKLCVVAELRTPKNQMSKRLKFKLLLNDKDILQAIEVPEDILTKSAGNDEGQFRLFGVIMILQPFEIEESCIIRVSAETDSEEMYSSALSINLGANKPSTVQQETMF